VCHNWCAVCSHRGSKKSHGTAMEALAGDAVEVRYDAEAISMKMISLFGLVVYSPISTQGPQDEK
jgi:hypothetical protein